MTDTQVILKELTASGGSWLITKNADVRIWNACVTLKNEGKVTMAKTQYGFANCPKFGWTVAVK